VATANMAEALASFMEHGVQNRLDDVARLQMPGAPLGEAGLI